VDFWPCNDLNDWDSQQKIRGRSQSFVAAARFWAGDFPD
jgi:hypothetical protein